MKLTEGGEWEVFGRAGRHSGATAVQQVAMTRTHAPGETEAVETLSCAFLRASLVGFQFSGFGVRGSGFGVRGSGLDDGIGLCAQRLPRANVISIDLQTRESSG